MNEVDDDIGSRVIGHEAAEDLIREHQVPIAPAQTVGEVLADLAARSPETLHTIAAHVSMAEAHAAKAFVSFSRVGAPKALGPDDNRRLLFESECLKFFDSRGDGKYCSVSTFIDGTRTAFVISHGAALRTQRVIGVSDAPEIHRFRYGRDAVVLVSSDGRNLEISARSGVERTFFVQAIGRVFFDGPEAFKASDRYDLEPICRPGFAAALDGATAADIAALSIRELVMVTRDELSSRVVISSRDVLATAPTRSFDLDLMEPVKATFAIIPREKGRRRVYRLTISGNNTRKTDVPWANDRVEELLQRLGLRRGGGA